MYIIKNAFQNLGRNRRRYLLQGTIVLLLLVGVCISIIIGDTLKAIIEDYGKRFQISASIEPDYMALLQSGKYNDFKDLSVEELESIANSKHVKKVNTSMDLGVKVENAISVGEDDEKSELPSGMNEETVDISGNSSIKCNAVLIGYNDLSLLTDFKNNTRKITEGRCYKNKNECIVSTELADKNKWKVGDTIRLQSAAKSKTFSLKIVGLYLDAKPLDKFSQEDPTANCRNDIIVNCDTITSNIEEGMYSTHASYILKSAEDVEGFNQELKEGKILDTYKLTTNKEEYEKIVEPVRKLGTIIRTFEIIIMFCGIVILIIISILSIHERTYEIGVLRSRGMKKSKLAIQFMLENIILVMLCLVIGLTISSLLAKPVSNTMLKEQIAVVEKNQNTDSTDEISNSVATFIDQSTSYVDNSELSQLKEITIQFSFIMLIKISMIALGLALLASMAGIFAVVRYEPSQILANRN